GTSHSHQLGSKARHHLRGFRGQRWANGDGLSRGPYQRDRVASTNSRDERSSFSNYGNQIVWVAAPGEAIVTTYPFGTYAPAWGTSFSAPLGSGGVSLLGGVRPGLDQTGARGAMAQAQLLLAVGMGEGRIDLYRAVGSVPGSY